MQVQEIFLGDAVDLQLHVYFIFLEEIASYIVTIFFHRLKRFFAVLVREREKACLVVKIVIFDNLQNHVIRFRVGAVAF